jgi:hypothetical protein
MTNLLYRNSSSPTVPVSTSTKGAPLTNLEVDGNFKSLSNDIGTKASTVYVDAQIDEVAIVAASDALSFAIALG